MSAVNPLHAGDARSATISRQKLYRYGPSRFAWTYCYTVAVEGYENPGGPWVGTGLHEATFHAKRHGAVHIIRTWEIKE